MLMQLRIVLFIFYVVTASTVPFKGKAQCLVINEIMAKNDTTISDGFGEDEDWIELYNCGTKDVNIGGMFFTDDTTKPWKYQIPTNKKSWTTIAPKDRMLIWADSDDEQGTRHLSFRLDDEGGSISIYSRDTILIDRLEYSKQSRDVSFGRKTDGDTDLNFFHTATPNAPNQGGINIFKKNVLPEFSIESGFYDSSVILILNNPHPGEVYYTVDGSEPDVPNGIKYSAPIKIDSTTIVRARIVKENYSPGQIVTRSYFINEKTTLPIVSLTADPKDLWHHKSGIYYKYKKRGWERPANVEYFDFNNDGGLFSAFNNDVRIRIAGKTSRRQPKKSFAIFTKDKYGYPRINYKIFRDKPIDSFGSIWLRADATSGRNVPELWVGERFKNELLYEVNKKMGSTVDMQAYQPVLVFLNGEYWGLYNLMERKGADFIENNHGITDADIITGEYEQLVSGKSRWYDSLTFFVSLNDITDDSVYKEVGKKMDIDNYIDYWIYEVYSSAHDNRVNIRYWRPKGKDQQWRWISYDQDSWHRYDENTLKRHVKKDPVFLFTRLMKNDTFRIKWANRMCDYLNTVLKDDNAIRLVDEIIDRIDVEVPREKERWQDTMLYVPKNMRVDWFKEYAVQRPCQIRDHIIKYYELDGTEKKVKIDATNGTGTVTISTITVDKFPWEGYYIEGIPVTLTAIPADGYRFVGWKDRKLPKTATIVTDLDQGTDFVPIFKKKLGRARAQLSRDSNN